MSLIDDLKDMMQRASIPESKQTQVVSELSKKYGGSKFYIRKKEGKKKPLFRRL